MVEFKLTINKKVIKFNVGIGFLGDYQDKTNQDINQIIENIEKNPWKTVPDLMYESALYQNRGNLDFEKRDLIDWIDKDGSYNNKGYLEFVKKFINCMTKNVPEENIEPSKKK